jgi:putative cell wall-binding protein
MRRVFASGLATGLMVVLLSGCVGTAVTPGHTASGRGPADANPAASQAGAAAATPRATVPIDGTPGGSVGAGDGDVPHGLDAAVRRDLGISTEQYFADAAAAGRASDIAPELAKGGIAPDQVWMEGSTINVHATSAAQRTLAESLGATPTTDTAPSVPKVAPKATAYDDLDNGTGWYWPLGAGGVLCSVGFNGYSSAGAPTMATAGHCVQGVTPQLPNGTSAYRWTQSGPGASGTPGALIGPLSASAFAFGAGDDSGLIPVTGPGMAPRAQVATWNGGTIPVRGLVQATVGAPICKSGRTTGWTCGTVEAVDYDQGILGADNTTIYTVNSVMTSMCMWHGDSGGPAMIGNLAVGINSSGTWTSQSCTDSDGYSAIYPLMGAPNSLTQTQPGWQLQVALDTPVVSSAVGGATPTVSGTVPNAATGTQVSLFIDGGATAAATTSVGPNGSWSFAPTGLGAGMHSVSVTASYGSFNRSAASATAYLPVGITTDRLSGADRSATSVEVSKSAYPDGAATVYVAFGWNFPDALVAAPAAVKAHGPVLLSSQGYVSDAIRAELQRLSPQNIVVVGDTASISNDVVLALSSLVPGATVTRQAGPDRYTTARSIVAAAFGTSGVSDLYISTGANFPDALAASAAAAATGNPVLTLPGWVDSLDQATTDAITALKPQHIIVVGGTPSVSAGIYAQLARLAPTIDRYGGTSRYETSRMLAQATYPSTATRVYLANGEGYADALAGSVVAGVKRQPLLITFNSCLPVSVTSAMVAWHSTAATLIGGLPSLGADVAALRPC